MVKKITLACAAIGATTGLITGALNNGDRLKGSYAVFKNNVQFYEHCHTMGYYPKRPEYYNKILGDTCMSFSVSVTRNLCIPSAVGAFAAVLAAGGFANYVTRRAELGQQEKSR